MSKLSLPSINIIVLNYLSNVQGAETTTVATADQSIIVSCSGFCTKVLAFNPLDTTLGGGGEGLAQLKMGRCSNNVSTHRYATVTTHYNSADYRNQAIKTELS